MIRTLFFLSIFGIACSQPDANFKKIDLEGTWVPEKIAWQRPEIDDPEIRNFTFASFATLSFRGQEFMMVESTNAPGDKDTINFYLESGYNLYHGKIKILDNLTIIEYKNVYRFMKITGDTISRLLTDTLMINGEHLLFQNERYRRILTIDTLDINGIWTHAASLEAKRTTFILSSRSSCPPCHTTPGNTSTLLLLD